MLDRVASSRPPLRLGDLAAIAAAELVGREQLRQASAELLELLEDLSRRTTHG